jgi:hypothetical protein
VSKVGGERDAQGGWIAAQRPEQLRAGVEANLRTLAVERLDVVNLRLFDAAEGGEPSGQAVDLDSQLEEMVALRHEGKIRGIGMSTVTVHQLRHALPAGIACVQNAYSLLDRSNEPVLDLCRQHDLAWVPYFPLGSAFPGIPKVTEHPAVMDAATSLGGHTGSDRPGVAPGSRPPRPRDPRDVEPGAPDREPRHRARSPGRRHDGGTGRLDSSAPLSMTPLIWHPAATTTTAMLAPSPRVIRDR